MRNSRIGNSDRQQHVLQSGGVLLLGMLLVSNIALGGEAEPVDSSISAMLSGPGMRYATPLTMPAPPLQMELEAPVASELWLRLQASGGAASQHPQAATAVEQELANQRFLDSYQYPIPEAFVDDSATSSGGSRGVGLGQ